MLEQMPKTETIVKLLNTWLNQSAPIPSTEVSDSTIDAIFNTSRSNPPRIEDLIMSAHLAIEGNIKGEIQYNLTNNSGIIAEKEHYEHLKQRFDILVQLVEDVIKCHEANRTA